MAQHVLGAASRTPDKLALAVMAETGMTPYSYAALEAAVRGTGTGLLRAGMTPGDILLLRLGNTAQFPIAYLGAIAVGIVPVPTSSQLTQAEVDAMVQTLKPKAVAQSASVSAPTAGACLSLSEAELHAMQALPACDYDMGPPERLAYIIYTSGTSGQARAVQHAHRAIWARQMMFQGWYGLTSEDRLCHAGAFNWTFTLGTGLMDPWTLGATALIAQDATPPEALLTLMKQHGATVFAAAPGVYRKLLKPRQPLDLPQLRHALSAGEKLSETLRTRWRDASGTEIYEAYGMSECSTFISASPTTPAAHGALGTAQPGRRVALLGPDGPVAQGEVGEIAVHRDDPGLMLGYLGAKQETEARFDGQWFKTGDLGRMDAQGQIYYEARKDDMMNAGGYRVSPLEVEAALSDFEGLSSLAVTDVEIKEDVRIIVGFYTSEQPIDEKALQRHAQNRLAGYKCPRHFQRLSALPLGPNNKLRRKALKALIAI